MKYFLALDEDGYLSSIYLSEGANDGTPFLYEIDSLDLSGERINAYHWNGNGLVFDDEKYAEIISEKRRSEEEAERSERIDAARAEITDAVLTATINTIDVDDNTALRWIDFYPGWRGGVEYQPAFKVQYDDRLWRCRQLHTSQAGFEPPNVPALWEEICESHSGTIDDPIPYNNNMALELDKYYSQFDVVYRCIRDTGVPVYNNLSDLVGIYVELA